MKKIISMIVVLLVLVGCQSAPNDKIKVGVIQWAAHPALDQAYEGMVEALKEAGEDKFEIIHKSADDDSSNAQLIVENFIQENVDIIYAIATPAAQTTQNLVANTDIPFIFNAVSDPVSAGLVESMEKPGGNGTGVSDAAPIKLQLELMKDMITGIQTVGILYNTGEANSLSQIEEINKIAPDLNLEIKTEGIANQADISLVAENMAQNVDAFYIITDNMIANAAPMLVSIANGHKVPVFMAESTQIENGVLASDSISYLELGKQAGSMIINITLNGKKAGEIPVEIAKETQLVINLKAAENLGIEIPQTLLERAEIVE